MNFDLAQLTPLDFRGDPLDGLARWPGDRPVALLHSGRFHPHWARWSVLAGPRAYYRFIDTDGGRSIWVDGGGPLAVTGVGPAPVPQFLHRPFDDLRRLLALPGLFLGYLAYDLGRWIEHLPATARCDRGWPIIELAWCPRYWLHDGSTGRWYASDPACGPPPLGEVEGDPPPGPLAPPQSLFTRPAYEATVQRVVDYIAAGDVFQVNLAQRFSTQLAGPWPLTPRALYRRLTGASPAWYGAYLELSGRRAIASTSPELFLDVDSGGGVTTRPIKGTRPATADPLELLHSPKDAAELTMIVDLLRNDLGRVCDYGSIKVLEPRTIETHPTVHHGVATITGRLHPSKDVLDLLRATLPGGSITGAPKVRAMQIIEELEPVRRGPYCGALGLLSARQTCLNVAIRTLLMEPAANDESMGAMDGLSTRAPVNQLTRFSVDFSVGGGIVADSRPAEEYQETIDKAQALLAALR